MPLFLTKLLPFRDILYGGIAIAAVIFWVHHNHVEQAKGAARIQRAVAAATVKANAQAAARIKLQTQQTAAVQRQVESTYENALAVAGSQHAADLRRLREYEVRRNSHPHGVLESTPSASAQTHGGSQSFERMGAVSAQLAAALREDDAALLQCWTERDSLTGK